jgi:hypothetical protein
MSYTPPEVLDIVLQQAATPPELSADVVLCAPSIDNILVTIDGAIVVSSDLSIDITRPDAALLSVDSAVVVDSDISLDVKTGESQRYTPPLLSTEIVLTEDIFGISSQIRDVVLCRPQSDIDRSVFVGIDGTVTVGGDVELGADIPEPRHVTLDSTIVVHPELSLDVTEFVVGVSIDTYADINVQSEIIGHYDPNVFRGAMLDKSSDLQYSKMQGMDNSGSFENSALKAASGTDSKETAKLLSVDNQAQFEANIKLTTSEQVLTERSKLVGTDSEQLYESQNFVDTKSQLKNENAKIVGQSDWLSFEAMLARQTQRKVQGEYSYLDAIMRGQGFELSKLVGYQYRNLIETAKLPSWFVGYLAPPLWQTVILREQLTAPTLPLGVTLCAPKSQSPRTKLSIAQSDIDVYGYLVLTAEENDGTNPQPQTGVIFVTNSVSLTRSDDGREIKLLDFSVGIDSNSYTWSFSATVPLSELSKVDTAREPQIGVDFVCNGNLWRFILDGCEDSIQFGESSLTIKGNAVSESVFSPARL